MRIVATGWLVLALLWWGPPAEAKIAPRVTVSGSGIQPITLDYVAPQGKLDSLDLLHASGMEGVVFEGRRAEARPSMSETELGPAYHLVWDLDLGPQPDPVQSLYPFARGGPVAFVEGGVFYDQRWSGGWVRAKPVVTGMLEGLGAVPPSTAPSASRAVSSSPAVGDEAGSGSFEAPLVRWEIWGAAVAALVAGAWVLRRRWPVRAG